MFSRLHLAAFNKDCSIVQSILNTGEVDINARDSFGCTALHYACALKQQTIEEQKASLEIVKLLIDKGANPFARAPDEQSVPVDTIQMEVSFVLYSY
jgi:ankyrin repeat protein